MFKFAIPVLHATSSAAAEELYCDRLAFKQTLRIDRLVAPLMLRPGLNEQIQGTRPGSKLSLER